MPLASPSRASATGGFDELDGASSCAETQLCDDQAQNSREKLDVLKAKLPLKQLMSGSKLGRQERNVRQYLGNRSLEPQGAKLLRNYSKLAPSAQAFIAIVFVNVHARCVCVCVCVCVCLCGNLCVKNIFPLCFGKASGF